MGGAQLSRARWLSCVCAREVEQAPSSAKNPVGLDLVVPCWFCICLITLYVGRRTRAQACRPRRGGQNKLLFKTHTKETAHSRAILLPLILSGRCRDTPITVARNHSHAARAHGTRRVAGLLVAAHGMACGTLNLTCSPQSIKGKLTAL